MKPTATVRRGQSRPLSAQRHLASVLALALAALVPAGCRREAPPSFAGTAPEKKSAGSSTTDYPLVGVVRDVKKVSGQVVIRHEEIPGFMGAMTMPFTVADRSVFDDLRVGDEVEAKLRVKSEGGVVRDYELVDLVVRKPALAAPPSLTLSLAGGEPQLRTGSTRLEPGETVPDFTMTTEDGESLALSDLRGDVVVLTFIYTRCPLPDFCPLMDRKFAELASAIDAVAGRAEHVRLISLSFDPEHDTPELLKKHAQAQGARRPLWTFAVAGHDELAKVAPGLGLSYGPTGTEIAHNLSTAVIDPRGELNTLLVGSSAKSWKTPELLKVISRLASEANNSR